MTDKFDFRTSLTTYMLKIKTFLLYQFRYFPSKKSLVVYDSTFSHGLVLTKIAINHNIESQFISNCDTY